MSSQIMIRIAEACDIQYVQTIVDEIASSAKERGTGICKRSPELIKQKIREGNAVIAFTENDQWVGFCYLQSWDNDQFVSTHSLIISPQYRKSNVAKQIKEKIFELAVQKYQGAKIFGLTTSLAVMKINSKLGYKPVTYSEITKNEEFWSACKTCVNYEILMSQNKKNCLCTAMLQDPNN